MYCSFAFDYNAKEHAIFVNQKVRASDKIQREIVRS